MFKAIKKAKLSNFIALLIDIIIVSAYGVITTNFKGSIEFIEREEFYLVLLVVVVLIPIIFISISLGSIHAQARKNYLTVNNTLGADVNEAYNFAQLGLLVYNAEREIIWCSDLFIERKIKVIGEDVIEKYKELKPFFEDDGSPASIQLFSEGRTYLVINVKELSLLIFKDTSDIHNLEIVREKEQPVLMTILLDNLASLAIIGKDEDYSGIQANVTKKIIDYCKKFGILFKKTKEDTFSCFLNEEIYERLVEDKFSLVEDVLECSKDSDIDLTISIGVARGSGDYLKLNDLCQEAINVAQSRGGCQTVVTNFAGHLEFYGTSKENKIGSNLIKNRTFAQSFYSVLSNYRQVFIIPHTDADFDAIGAALGVYSIAKTLEKDVYIACEEKQIEMKARMMFKDYFNPSDYLISPAKAQTLLNDETLLVVVDVHRQSITTAPKLIEDAKYIALIDHHRRAEDIIDNISFNYLEPNASSASELVSNMIVNCPAKVEISQDVATYLMAGILLDTRGFKTRTGASTFKAAMDLKEFGADTKVCDSYMKDEFETFELKTKTLSSVEIPMFGVGVAIVPEDLIVTRTILATIAEQLNNVKGLKASFVIGNIENKKVGISARSDGSVNVQLIMERLGGGGHHSEGACQIENKKISEVKDLLISSLKEHRDEID